MPSLIFLKIKRKRRVKKIYFQVFFILLKIYRILRDFDRHHINYFFKVPTQGFRMSGAKKQKKNIIRDDLRDHSQAFTYYFIKALNSKIRMNTQT